MTLDVIGAGLGRTGTLSLRSALTELGYPCGHMMEVLFHSRHKTDVDFWLEVIDDPARADRSWERVLTGLRAVVDFPACAAWRGMVSAFPEAKVIFTLHPHGAEGWYKSTHATIYSGTGLEAGSEFGKKINAMMDGLVWNGIMKGTMDDRDAALARYASHLEEVKDTVPANRLLVYCVTEGWGPLCNFLDLPVPDHPFPQVNAREEMARTTARLQRMRSFGLGKPAAQGS